MMLTISLDYDGTFTADPPLWRTFIAYARSAGHRVLLVSCRSCECTADGGKCENHIDLFDAVGCSVLLTNGAPKGWFMKERGIKVDIWIDDMPESITYGR